MCLKAVLVWATTLHFGSPDRMEKSTRLATLGKESGCQWAAIGTAVSGKPAGCVRIDHCCGLGIPGGNGDLAWDPAYALLVPAQMVVAEFGRSRGQEEDGG